MNLSDIITKCYILALIIRDDGERLLLGDGIFEFKSSLQHFAPNIYQNDIVELQGTDGQLLAGQVRRSATQAFDGYIADGTIGKTDTEQSRRRFLGFFRKKHHYKVVYIMPDGTAIQRDRGYIVDAPAVQELYQRFPEYHIGLNFEDPNYYEYEEDGEGEEIPANTALISLANLLAGGLVWDNLGAVSQEKTWLDWENGTTVDGFYSFNNGLAGAPLEFTQLFGNTTQQTYTGKNLVSTSFHIATIVDYGENGFILTKPTTRTQALDFPTPLPAGTYTFSANVVANTADSTIGIQPRSTNSAYTTFSIQPGQTGGITFTVTTTGEMTRLYFYILNDATDGSSITFDKIQLESGSTATDFEKFVGGTASPNPDYPQDVNVVSGAQTVKITGKNLFNPDQPTGINHSLTYTNNGDGSFSITGTSDAVSSRALGASFSIRLKEGQTYALSANNPIADSDAIMRLVRDGGGVFASKNLTSVNATWTYTATQDDICTVQMRFPSGKTLNGFMVKPQIELGNQASDFEPYQEQTQVINLGALELAKIGTYQDYIWNDEGTWKIHKEVGKVVFDGSETWTMFANGKSLYHNQADSLIGSDTSAVSSIRSDYYTAESYTDVYNGRMDYGIALTAGTTSHRIVVRNKDMADATAFKTWLSTHNTTVYYALDTPTDTKITDQKLIQELSTIAKTHQGVNNIWLIPSGGAQGELSVHYATGSIDVGAGYEWEEGSGDNSNIVENPGIDRVNPIWKVPGPATNPTLTNITTGQTISWIGSVASGEMLTVDLNNQTAELGGANVFSQLSGDWLALAPGANRLEYSATGATEGCTLEWNGVVG